MAFPYVYGSCLLRMTVVAKDDQGNDVSTKWNTTTRDECGANGLLRPPKAPASFLVPSAPFGAVVGKIGGSTADPPDTSPSGGPYPGRKAFAVGNYTVVSLAASDYGPLFLTMNDNPSGFAEHAGELWVLIEEAPIPPTP